MIQQNMLYVSVYHSESSTNTDKYKTMETNSLR